MSQSIEPASPLYRTDLAQTPLPEILVTIHRYGVPGRLECRHGDDAEVLFIDGGQIVSASAPIHQALDLIFSWGSGNIEFLPGRQNDHFEFHEAPVPIRRAILRGVSRIPNAQPLLARIGTRNTLLQRTAIPIDIELSSEEQALLDAANGKRTLFEVVNLSGNPSANARTLYALFVLGFLSERERHHIKVQLKTKTPLA